MANPIVILGWTADDKVPGFYGETKFGQGRVSVGAFPVKCVLTGTKASDGTMTADQDIEPIISLDDSMVKLGARPTSTQQARAALSVEGVTLYAAPPAEAAGNKATISIAWGGSWSTAGTVNFFLDGQLVPVDIAATGESTSDVAETCENNFNGWADGPVTAATGAAVLTGTVAINSLSFAFPNDFGTKTFSFIIDGVTKSVTFSTPADEAAVLTQINAVLLTSATATVNGSHYLVITSLTTGAVSSVKILEGSLLATTIGFTNGQVNYGTSTTTLTVTSSGTQGNQYKLAWDMSEAPAGLTVTVTGGTAIHDKLVPFSGGTGTESLANVITLLKTDVFDYIAAAQTDATNLGLLEAHMASEAGPTIGHLEHMVCGQTGTLAAAQSISQTTLNDARSAVVWMQYCETHPAEIAAGVAALRSVIEPQNPNYNYDDFTLSFVTPQRWRTDVAQHTTLKAALNTGITPLKTENGVTKITRGIVSRCLDGSSPNYNTLDWGDAIVPDRIRKEVAASWVDFKASNPYVGRDVVGSEKAQDEGIGTPNLWNSAVIMVLKDAEKNNWVQDVDDNLPQTVLDTTRRALMSVIPVIVRWQQHSIGVSVRQQAA